MAQRQALHDLLCDILSSSHVYFQPPESLKMTYPCIVYVRSRIHARHASNRPYSLHKQYTVTVIDKDPDSTIPDRIAALPLCSFDRHYTADNLNHDVFSLYF